MIKILRFLFTARQTLSIAWKLLGDPKVPVSLKFLLPVLSVIYLISPIDLLPFLPFDDIVVVGLALKFFVELAKPLSTEYAEAGQESGTEASEANDEAIFTTWRVVEEDEETNM